MRKLALLAAVAATPALAGAETVFTDRGAFEAAVSTPLFFESFESYANDFGPAGTNSYDVFDVTYTDVSPNASGFGIQRDANIPDGIFATDGDAFFAVDFETPNIPTLTFTFDAPTNAFGTDIIDFENGTLSYTLSTGETGNAANAASNGTVAFFGVASDTPFTSVTFSDTPRGIDAVIFDRVLVAIPEPAAGIAALGLLGLIGLRRRS